MLFLPNNLTQGRHLASIFLVDRPRICKVSVAVPPRTEVAIEYVFTAVALVARQEEPKILLPVIIVEALDMWPASVPHHI